MSRFCGSIFLLAARFVGQFTGLEFAEHFVVPRAWLETIVTQPDSTPLAHVMTEIRAPNAPTVVRVVVFVIRWDEVMTTRPRHLRKSTRDCKSVAWYAGIRNSAGQQNTQCRAGAQAGRPLQPKLATIVMKWYLMRTGASSVNFTGAN